jgi:hypothetical protein
MARKRPQIAVLNESTMISVGSRRQRRGRRHKRGDPKNHA